MKLSHLALLLWALAASACGGNNAGPDDPPAAQETDLATLPSGNTMVLYEANPKLFSQTAALKSIESNLDRISSLGANVVWLMPVYPVGKVNSVNSPYCVRDYKAVNPEFGTLDDLKSLIKTAHAKGMKIILDWVANHTAWDHAWITEHPDWYTKDANGKIVSPPGMGWNDVADLNYNSAAMRAAMKEAMLWWISTADVDGFRCDYTDGVPTDFWSDAFADIRKAKSGAILLGESSDTKFYNCGFDLLYAWSYPGALKTVFGGGPLTGLYNTVKSDSNVPEGKSRMRYIINHDTASESSLTSMYRSKEGALAAWVLTAFLPGVPMIYSSQEIGYDRTINFFNYNILQWTSAPAYSTAYGQVMKAYRDSEKYRGSEAPQLLENGSVATVLYKAGTRRLLVLVNTSVSSQTIPAPMAVVGGTFKDLISGQSAELSSSITLPAYGYKILAK